MPFLTREFPNCAADWNSGAWGWLATGRTFLKLTGERQKALCLPKPWEFSISSVPCPDLVVRAASKALSERKTWMLSCRAAQCWCVPGLGLEVQLGWVELLLLQKLPSSFS